MEPRRSHRLKKTTATPIPSHDGVTGSSRKSSRNGTGSKGGGSEPRHSKTRVRGKLRILPDMPLDILFETFGNLNPSDVLNLSRSTKALRGILMRRSAITIWKQAFLNVPGLPPCPKDMSEPQYANLAYGRHCHFCLASNVQDVVVQYRVRCCGACFPKKFIFVYGRNMDDPLLLDIGSHNRDLVPVIHRQKGPFILISEAHAVAKELESVKGDILKLESFKADRRRLVEERQQHGYIFGQWLQKLYSERTSELRLARARRKLAIFDRLGSEGLEEEIKKLSHQQRYALSTHPLVKQSKDLTDRIWDNIKPTLVQFLEDARAERLRQERKAQILVRTNTLRSLLEDYSFTRPKNEIIPEEVDICNMEPFRSLVLESDSTAAPDFAKAILQLPELSEEWRESKKVALLNLMPQVEGKDDDLARLDLASTYFSCARCLEPISYPRILVHKCMTHVGHVREAALQHGDLAVLADVFSSLGGLPWDLKRTGLEFDQEASNDAEDIVAACGKDLAVTTTAEMDTLDARLQCVPCFQSTGNKRHLVMSWKTAILHKLERHLTDSTFNRSSWKLVDEAVAMVAKDAEAKKAVKSHAITDVCCAFCKKKINEHYISTHLQFFHRDAIQGLRKEDCVVRLLDVPMRRTTPVAVRICM